VDVGQTVAASFNTPTLFVIANDLSKMQIDSLVSEADIGGVAVGQDVNFTVDAYPYRTFHGRVNQVRYGAVTNQNVVTYDSIISVSNADLKLLPSMTANVQIITAQRNDTLKIPNAALRFHPPETPGADSHTNATAQTQAQGSRREGDAGGRGGQGGQGGGRRGEPGQSGPGDGVRPRPDRPVIRTVYVLPSARDSKDPENAKPKPVQIKVGISDGISTEVLDGLEEGAQIVIGAITSADTASRSSSPASNPFGGGMRRF
jgi:HlyD family secretion protein